MGFHMGFIGCYRENEPKKNVLECRSSEFSSDALVMWCLTWIRSNF